MALHLCLLGWLVGPGLSHAAPPFSEFVDPNPNAGNGFGTVVVPLSSGNVVITSPGDDFNGPDSGAVYLFNGATGVLISTLRGHQSGCQVGSGGVVALTNGHYVVVSPLWDIDGSVVNVGAVTWCSGTTGLSGTVSSSNSLTGTQLGDQIGSAGVTALTNGNYVVASQFWNNGGTSDTGAVTLCNGATGTSGVVSTSNSLYGTIANDNVGSLGVVALTNGNYVVRSSAWDNGGQVDAGAVTWGSGTTGVTGAVSSSNSLVGSTTGDGIGSGGVFDGRGVMALSNGNYLVRSHFWDNGAVSNVGAVTWGNGAAGISGVISSSNSLIGSTADDRVGFESVTVLSNGNYVVRSPIWNNGGLVDAGAVTWGSGASGVSGVISSSNSLVGSAADDQVGVPSVQALSDGSYVVCSHLWNNGATGNAGAATWCNGVTGRTGTITSGNSLVGTTGGDQVGQGGVVELTNGNYVVISQGWDNGAVSNAGAVTWSSGASPITGAVTTSNSLVGTTNSDQVGNAGVTALSNGHYVVASGVWDNAGMSGIGAVTWCDGTTGRSGAVTTANSLVGSASDNGVGGGGVTALTNGNYVVRSPSWDDGVTSNVGAATWCDGSTGRTGTVTTANSFYGATAGESVSSGGVVALTNGNYVVRSPGWFNGAFTSAGAVTWGNGATGSTGFVTFSNSLVGERANDQVGNVTALSNGNYVVRSQNWDNGGSVDAGAVTWGSGTGGTTSLITSSNSLLGLTASTSLQTVVVDEVNGTIIGRFIAEGNGKVRVTSLFDGQTPSAPEIVVYDGTTTGTNLTDNVMPARSFGTMNTGGSGTAQTFTIQNTGSASLTGIAVTSTNNSEFTVDTPGMSTTLAPNGTTTFTVTFNPSATGTRTGVINVASNDANENPFEINVTGTGVTLDYSITTTGGVVTLTDLTSGGTTLSVTQPSAGNIQFSATGRSFKVDVGAVVLGSSDPVSLAGVTSITAGNSGAVTVDGTSLSTGGAGLTLNAANGLTINAPVNTGGGALNINADSDNNGAGTLTLSAATFNTWTQQQKLNDSPTSGTWKFGVSSALSSDGSTAIIGSNGFSGDQGSATIFTRSLGGVWTQQQRLTDPAGVSSENFGFSVALSSDGNTAIVGVINGIVGANNYQGRARVYTRTAGVWTLQQQLVDSDGAANDLFGTSVALSSDGNTALIGAYNDTVGGNTLQGSASVFTRSGGVWTQQQKLTEATGTANNYFGYSAALSSDGNTAIIGAWASTVGGNSGQGAVLVYTRSAGVWTQQQRLTESGGGAAGDGFGYSVALSGNGDIALIGVIADEVGANNNQGSALIFTRSAGVWTQQQRLTESGGGDHTDVFGSTVALSSDGSIAFIGAEMDDVLPGNNEGTVFAFQRVGGVWTQAQRLTDSAGTPNEQFGGGKGLSTSSDGSTVMVGGLRDDVSGVDSGSATAFVIGTPGVAGGAIVLGAGTASLTAANVDLQNTISTSSTVTLLSTAARPVNVGTETGGSLSLTDTELDRITADTVTIGNGISGTLTLSAAISPLSYQTLALGRNSTFSGTGGFVADVTSASVYEKITVTGTMTITAGATFTASSVGGYIWNGTDAFTFLDNDGTDAITGIFTGPTLTNFLGSMLTAPGSYVAGSGNDFVVGSHLPEIVVFDGTTAGTNLADNALPARGFGTRVVGSSGTAQTFTIQNTGAGSLTGLAVTSTNSGEFTVDTTGMSTSLAQNATTTFTVTFTPSATGTRTGVINIASNDGDENPFEINVTGEGITATFANTTSIDVPAGQPGTTSGPASPYSSTINVSGVSGTVTNLTLRLLDISHGFPDDLDILLVGPGGQTCMLMSDSGGGNAISGVNLSFTSAAGSSLPDSVQITSGTYQPTDFEAGDTFPAPAPAGPYGTSLAGFDGTNANGAWTIYVMDDATGNVGTIAGGWALDITTNASASAEIVVFDGTTAGTNLADNALPARSFGSRTVGSSGTAQTFTIQNTGAGSLAGLVVTSTNSTEFTVDTTGMSATLAQNATTTFTVTFTPSNQGTRTGVINIASNDGDENPFEINVTGIGTADAARVYEFTNSLAESGGGTPMTSGGGTLTPTTYDFGTNQGPSLTGAFADAASYSIEMTFQLADLTGLRKLVDFKGLTTDEGLYFSNGQLHFPGLGGATGGPVINAGDSVHVVLTRDSSTNQLVGYVNGVQAFSVADAGGLGVAIPPPAGTLNFFRDDNGGTEASAGSVDQIRLYNFALTPSQVAALAPMPEIVVHNGSHGLAAELSDGQVTVVNFGSTAPGFSSIRNFLVRNTGAAHLHLSSISVPPGFTTNGAATALAPGASYGFQVSFGSALPNTYAGSITLSSDDLSEAAFDFPVTGTVVAPGSGPVINVGGEVAVQGVAGSSALGGPVGSTLYSFIGSPALNSSGVLASAVQIRHADASLHTGMMVGQPMVVLSTDTQAVPSLPGVNHYNFGPPVINEAGHVAFTGEVRGTGITTNVNSRCLFSNASDGTLKLIARTGTSVGLTSNLKTIGNFSIGGDLVIFLGTLVDNSTFLFGWDANTGLRPLMRNGQSLDANGVTKTVKSFSILENTNASSGHGKDISVAPTGETLVTVNVAFTDGTFGVVVGSFDGTSDTGFGHTYGTSQQPADSYAAPGVIPLAKWNTFRSPGFDNAGTYYGFISQMVTSVAAGVSSTNNVGIFVDTAPGVLTLQLRENDVATGTGGLVFSDFSDLVLGSADYEFFVKAEVRGSGVVTNVNSAGLWAQHATNGLMLVAREGSEAPGVVGSTFFRLNQIALPGAAQPIFQATMKTGAAGVTTANDTGLWVVNANEEVKLAVREGDVINVGGTDRTVTAITALLNGTTTGGALGRRVFLEDGQLTLLLTFSGGVQTHARVVVP